MILIEVGSETTTLDNIENTWSTPENCVRAKLLKQKAKKPIYPITADLKENRLFIFSEFNDTDKKEMNLKIKAFPEDKKFYQQPRKLYKTIYGSLFVTY